MLDHYTTGLLPYSLLPLFIKVFFSLGKLKYLPAQIISMHSGTVGWKAIKSPSFQKKTTKKTGKSC